MDSGASDKLKADLQEIVDAHNRLLNNIIPYLKEFTVEDYKATNNNSEPYSIARAKYLANLVNVKNLITLSRNSIYITNSRKDIEELKGLANVSVTALF